VKLWSGALSIKYLRNSVCKPRKSRTNILLFEAAQNVGCPLTRRAGISFVRIGSRLYWRTHEETSMCLRHPPSAHARVDDSGVRSASDGIGSCQSTQREGVDSRAQWGLWSIKARA